MEQQFDTATPTAIAAKGAKSQPLILVVDDEPKIVELVTSYLERSGYRVLSANTGAQALALLAQREVALILLDLMLPDLPGEHVCLRIREQTNTPIIMLTAKIDDSSIVAGLNSGADDYVTKPFSPKQLVARVGAVLRRGTGASQPLASRLNSGALTLDLDRRSATFNGRPLELTASEFSIIEVLMRHPRQALSRAQIIAAIHEDAFEVYDRAIDTHVKNIRQKIESDSRAPRYIKTIYGLGYRWGEEVSP
jgi:DNA-binding response OmpR family regulator